MLKQSILVIFIVSLLLGACKDEKKKLLVDLSKIEKPNIKIKRYEKDLFSIDRVNLAEGLNSLKSKYPFFLGTNPTDTFALIQMQGYLSDPLIIEVYKDVMEKYPDVNYIEEQLSQAFHYYKFHFPDSKTPEIYTYISGLDYEAPVKYIEDSIMIIAIDMYLGKNYKYYPRVGVPQYKTQGFLKENVAVDCMKEIAKTKLPDVSQNQKLIDYMVHHGKIHFFIDAMLPELADSIKIVYTQKQMDWCNNNESRVWSYLIDQDLLYTNDLFLINKFVGDAPFTAVFTNESAPRVANWIGWRIVRKYMFMQEGIDLEKVLSPDMDGQTILNKSKFKPRK